MAWARGVLGQVLGQVVGQVLAQPLGSSKNEMLQRRRFTCVGDAHSMDISMGACLCRRFCRSNANIISVAWARGELGQMVGQVLGQNPRASKREMPQMLHVICINAVLGMVRSRGVSLFRR